MMDSAAKDFTEPCNPLDTSSTNCSSLPACTLDEVWEAIIKHIPSPVDLKNLCLVNKQCGMIAREFLWYEPRLKILTVRCFEHIRGMPIHKLEFPQYRADYDNELPKSLHQEKPEHSHLVIPSGSDRFFRLLGTLVTLRSLKFTDNRQLIIDCTNLMKLAQLPHLTSLTIGDPHPGPGQTENIVQGVAQLLRNSKVTRLHLRFLYAVLNTREITAMLDFQPNAIEDLALVLSDEEENYEDIFVIFDKLQRLKSLHIKVRFHQDEWKAKYEQLKGSCYEFSQCHPEYQTDTCTKKMIKFAVVHRARDGLALSASTDTESGIELRDSKRYAKLVSRKARNYPVRSTLAVGRFRIYFTTESDVCFLLICEINYAAVLAFSFLDDLKKEFFANYTKGAVDKAVRPYSFIDFDNVIQKTKQRYNNTRALYTRIDLSHISTELQNCPPFEVPESELGIAASSSVASNGTLLSAPPSTTNVIKGKLSPLSTTATISLLLTALCVLLNIIRLVPFVSQHTPSTEEEDSWMGTSLCFLASSIANGLQCYTLLYPVRQRKVVNVLLCLMSVLLVYALFDLRNTVQVAFHLLSSFFICYSTWCRPLLGKLPNYNL